MGDFYNTQMGKNFYEGTMKKIVVQMKRQADAAEKQNELLEKINANLSILAKNAASANEAAESDTPWLDGIANIHIDNMDLSVRTIICSTGLKSALCMRSSISCGQAAASMRKSSWASVTAERSVQGK